VADVVTKAGPQERFESSRGGRIAISVFVVVTLFAIVVDNLPESRLRRDAMKAGEPYLVATGLDQNWRIFAPPRRLSLDVQAQVRFADGSVAVWHPPEGGDLIGAYWDYRWRKWIENATQEPDRRALWRPAALFAAHDLERPGRVATSVTLVRRWRDLHPPGASTPAGPWGAYAYYRLPAGELGGR
jgi:hypothetical protein